MSCLSKHTGQVDKKGKRSEKMDLSMSIVTECLLKVTTPKFSPVELELEAELREVASAMFAVFTFGNEQNLPMYLCCLNLRQSRDIFSPVILVKRITLRIDPGGTHGRRPCDMVASEYHEPSQFKSCPVLQESCTQSNAYP